MDHVLIDPRPGGAIAIVHGDREAIAADDRDGVRRRASSRRARRLLRRERTPRYETLCTGGSPGPPEASGVRGDGDDGPCAEADGAAAAAPWSTCTIAF